MPGHSLGRRFVICDTTGDMPSLESRMEFSIPLSADDPHKSYGRGRVYGNAGQQ